MESVWAVRSAVEGVDENRNENRKRKSCRGAWRVSSVLGPCGAVPVRRGRGRGPWRVRRGVVGCIDYCLYPRGTATHPEQSTRTNDSPSPTSTTRDHRAPHVCHRVARATPLYVKYRYRTRTDGMPDTLRLEIGEH